MEYRFKSGVLRAQGGGARFLLQYRRAGGNEGWTLRVYGNDKERQVEFVRFNCFKKQPHYRLDPGGRDEEVNLDTDRIADPSSRMIEEFRHGLPDMIERARFGEFSRRINRQEVMAALAELGKKIEKIRPLS